MKFVIFLQLLVLMIPRSVRGDEPRTFEEFKSLPRSERDALLTNTITPAVDRFYQWNQRIYMGEELWHRSELESVLRQHGFSELLNLFIIHQSLREQYLEQWLAAKKRIITSKVDLANATNRYSRERKVAATTTCDIIPLLATLAPSPEAKALNKHAGDLLDNWFVKWPEGTKWTVTSKDMTKIDASMARISTRLNALRKLTPEELQKAIDALPVNQLSNESQ